MIVYKTKPGVFNTNESKSRACVNYKGDIEKTILSIDSFIKNYKKSDTKKSDW